MGYLDVFIGLFTCIRRRLLLRRLRLRLYPLLLLLFSLRLRLRLLLRLLRLRRLLRLTNDGRVTGGGEERRQRGDVNLR